MSVHAGGSTLALFAQVELVPRGTRAVVFEHTFEVFLGLGVLVGVVVVAYMLYNAYRYRDGEHRDDDFEPPTLGELPVGGGGGRKLFTSFALSTIIVISLVAWTYMTLLYVEDPPEAEAEVDVEGYRFGWEFTYPNGHESDGVLRVPRGEVVRLRVTSSDVFHNFGVPELRVKTDAVPGQTTTTWVEAGETGNYTAKCYELCGSGHSYMTATVVVMEPDEYREWYANTTNNSS
ncbi:cytochrome c oxidase subunit II [Halobellus sp. GM3]|uniref:cytochrome c oxidase subunit II n=1 Tax=Halobellus sp. GM3 TaxID=3458410 RepID=UPI00403DD971